MPSASNSFAIPRVFCRCVSTRTPISGKSHPNIVRTPRSPLKRPKPKATRITNENLKPSLLDRVLPRSSKTRRYAFRILVLSPIIGMGLLHAPYEIMWVNGASMSPLLNANHNPDIDLPNANSDRILVQIHGVPDLLPDVNSVRKSKRNLEGKESVEEDAEQLSRFKRGQIVTFYTPHSPDKVAVKRIVGIPGDRVQPLAGYAGGDDAVIVPWNHLWVEGDAESRQKSIDSNWYGPISQNLVIGEVKVVLTPWWSPTWIDWKQHKWPALLKNRVEQAAVLEEASDPQIVSILQEWTDGTNRERLEAMRESPEAFATYFASSEDVRRRVRRFYRNAALVLAKDDPDGERFELAQEVIKEMETIYGAATLRQGMVKRSAKVQASSLKLEDQQAAVAADQSLQTQGWTIERDGSGKVITRSPSA